MALFTIKTDKKQAIPTDQVLKLRQQGFADDSIVEMLQKDGFKSHQIFEAMSQADIKGMVVPETLENIPAPENPMQPKLGMPSELPPLPAQSERITTDKIQEIAESIIDEKWDLLVENVNKIIDWKERVEKSMAEISKKVNELDTRMAKSSTEVSAQLETQEKVMENVDAEVKAFTKVLQKVLPDLMAHEVKSTPVKFKASEAPEQEAEKPKKKSRTEEIFGSIEDIS